jgi:hypothetical protein
VVSPSIAELVSRGHLEHVDADDDESASLLEHAEAHLRSATSLMDSDPAGAYQLLYDAARKAVVADMLANGYRVKANRPGAHATTVQYAEIELAGSVDDDALRHFDQMRRSRNRSEYGGLTIGRRQLEADLRYATAIVTTVVTRVGGRTS